MAKGPLALPEWPKLATLNFFQQYFPKKTSINVERAKIVRKNSEQIFLAIPNFVIFLSLIRTDLTVLLRKFFIS